MLPLPLLLPMTLLKLIFNRFCKHNCCTREHWSWEVLYLMKNTETHTLRNILNFLFKSLFKNIALSVSWWWAGSAAAQLQQMYFKDICVLCATFKIGSHSAMAVTSPKIQLTTLVDKIYTFSLSITRVGSYVRYK